MKQMVVQWLLLTAVMLAGGVAPSLAEDEPAEKPPATEQEQAEEREYRERLRRAREREERERSEYGKRRDGELARQTEISRLQMRITTLEREESSLSSQVLSTEQQLLYTRPDPADHSAASRLGELRSRLSFMRSQLQQKTFERQSAQRQLENARFR
jgi:hypothetical protein